SLLESSDTVTISTSNRVPNPDAGADISASHGTLVALDGTGSTDGDTCDTLTSWQWTQTAGGAVTLSDPTSPTPTFTAPVVDAVLTFELVVSDGDDDSAADPVTVTVQDQAPVAEAGGDQTALLNDTITLDGTASYDPEGAGLSHLWSFVGGPGAVVLSDPTSAIQQVSLPGVVGGTFVFSLVVNDGLLDSAPDQVRVSTPSTSPVADAGPDLAANGGEL
ncbi:MAG: peptidase M36, partial [Actinomycetia bacterium]|nr:peptidase M36 [Actinomycetes bacterium]